MAVEELDQAFQAWVGDVHFPVHRELVIVTLSATI